jgi:RNA polymerase sigma factor (sigma-70 family)
VSILLMDVDLPRPLLLEAAAGDQAALTTLYLELRPAVVALCRRYLRSTGEAEEAAAEVLVRLDRLARDFDGRIDFRHWVLRAAGHHCIDVLRRRAIERQWVDAGTRAAAAAPVDRADSPIAALIAEEDRQRLRDAIDRLTEAPRAALVLRYFASARVRRAIDDWAGRPLRAEAHGACR